MALPFDARRPDGRPLRSCLLLWLRSSPAPAGSQSALPPSPAPQRAGRPSRPRRLHRPDDLSGEGRGNRLLHQRGAIGPLRWMDHSRRRGRPDLLRPGRRAPRPQRRAVTRRATNALARPRSCREERDPSQDRHASHYGRDGNGLLRLLGRRDRADLEDLLLLRVGDSLVGEGDQAQDQERDADDGQWPLHAPLHGNESWKPPRVSTSSSLNAPPSAECGRSYSTSYASGRAPRAARSLPACHPTRLEVSSAHPPRRREPDGRGLRLRLPRSAGGPAPPSPRRVRYGAGAPGHRVDRSVAPAHHGPYLPWPVSDSGAPAPRGPPSCRSGPCPYGISSSCEYVTTRSRALVPSSNYARAMPRRDHSRAVRKAPRAAANGRASSAPETLTGKTEAGTCLAVFRAHESVDALLAMAR